MPALEERRHCGLILEERIRAEIAKSGDPDAGIIPDDSTITRLETEWLPDGFFNCLKMSHPECRGPASCGERCTARYWREHSASVASMMGNLARLLDEDEHLWRATGRLHDLDYLKGPHHRFSVPNEEAHPVAIAEWLVDNHAPPSMALAILEHSPHLRLGPSLPICQALVAADEHGTMKGVGITPLYPTGIPPEFIAALDDAPRVPFSGFHRPEMNERASRALLRLAAARC